MLCCEEMPDGSEVTVKNYNEFLESMTVVASDLTESIAGIRGTLGVRKRRS